MTSFITESVQQILQRRFPVKNVQVDVNDCQATRRNVGFVANKFTTYDISQWNQFYDHPRTGVGKKCAIYWRCAFTVIQNTVVIVIDAEIEHKKVKRVSKTKQDSSSFIVLYTDVLLCISEFILDEITS